MSYSISAVDRAIQLLEVMAETPDAGVSELAERTGFTKSLIFRLLFTLEERGFVIKDAVRRTYSLGWRAMLLGDDARRQSKLISSAEPYMDQLFLAFGHNVILQILDRDSSVVIAQRRARTDGRVYANAMRRGPLYAGGGSKVLLAYAPSDVTERVLSQPLARFTPNTICDSERLREVLAVIRRDGWAISNAEVDHDVTSVAVPVFSANGEPVAALSVNGNSATLSPESCGLILDQLRAATSQIARMIGNFTISKASA